MSADTRLRLGVALLILGLVMPAGSLCNQNSVHRPAAATRPRRRGDRVKRRRNLL